MEDAGRRYALKVLVGLIGTAFLPSCSFLAGRRSNCNNYKFDQITNPVIDMHAHFFNATDLLVVEYIEGPALNDIVGDNYKFLRVLLRRIANAILTLEKIRRPHIKASSEYIWLKSNNTCSPRDEYATVSKQFFELISEQDKSKSLSLTDSLEQLPFNILLIEASKEIRSTARNIFHDISVNPPAIKFDENTILRAVMHDGLGQSAFGFNKDVSKCPSDPGMLVRIFAFLGRALVRRSTNVQAYYDRYSLIPVDGFGVKHVLNIGCDFDFFLDSDDRKNESSIEDQIKVNEEIWRHTNEYAIPVLGVNPWKMYHDNNYAALIDKTLERGIYKGVKLYPSIGYSVEGDIRDGVKTRIRDGKGVSQEIIKRGMEKLICIVAHRGAYLTSHTTYSKGAEPGSEALAGSKYWIEHLRCYPDLKVNFGHMGDPSDKGGSEWRKGFMSLMRTYDNVYADFGYHEYDNYEILKNDLTSFRNEYGNEIFKKIAYGSDWFMISKDEGSNAYLCSAVNNFRRAVRENVINDDNLKDMFYNNAERFLNSGKVPQNTLCLDKCR